MESHQTKPKVGGWVLVIVAYLVGALGIFFSLGVGFLILFAAEMEPTARKAAVLFMGLIFAVSVFILFLAGRQAKRLRSRR
jgi:hypothetical protein